MSTARLAVTVAVCALASACATAPHQGGLERGAPKLTISEQRGRDFAVRRCGGCHNVGLDDAPPYEGPSFRRLGVRYNTISLERRFAEVSEHGVDMMPPVSFTRGEGSDLINYINTLPAP